MRHFERAMQSSLEAANNHSTSLQHRVAQVVAESCRLHQLLFDTQQCLEGIKAERTILTGKLNDMEDQSKRVLLTKKKVSVLLRSYESYSCNEYFYNCSFVFCVGNRVFKKNCDGKIDKCGTLKRKTNTTYK